MPSCTFTAEEFKAAHEAWGCNCGPAALAFALQTTLAAVRPAIPQFEERRYTSPMMMAAALRHFGQEFAPVNNPSGGFNYQHGLRSMFGGPLSLVRIQWTGPWTAITGNAKWAARQTHWIACWMEAVARAQWSARVFDCNGGITSVENWEGNIVPAIVATIPRADGGWFPANVWRLR